MASVVARVLRYDGKAARVNASGGHDGRMRPLVGLRNRWLSKEGLKGAVVGVVFVGVFGWRSSAAAVGLRRRLITIAPVRMMRMSFL